MLSRRIAAAALAVTTLGGVGVISYTAQHADAAPAGHGRATQAVNVRSLPKVSTGRVTSVLATGRTVSIACQITGDTVWSPLAQANSNLWSYSPDVDGFISDALLDTGHNGPIPGVPTCRNVGGQPSTKPAGRATEPVNIRTLPRLSGSRVTGQLSTGRAVSIACQITGDTVWSPLAQANSNLWSYSPDVDGFISDALLDTGHNGPIPGVPTCKNVARPPAQPTKPSKPTKTTLVPVRQGQGQDGYQWIDCGPTSLVVSVLAMGKTPTAWDPNNQGPAIIAARGAMGFNPAMQHGTTSDHAVRGLQAYGLSARRTTSVDDVLAHARAGKPSMLMGELQTATWPVNVVGTAPILHWMVIGGYDAATDQYLVVDPASRVEANRVHRVKASWVHQYSNANPGQGGVLIG